MKLAEGTNCFVFLCYVPFSTYDTILPVLLCILFWIQIQRQGFLYLVSDRYFQHLRVKQIKFYSNSLEHFESTWLNSSLNTKKPHQNKTHWMNQLFNSKYNNFAFCYRYFKVAKNWFVPKPFYNYTELCENTYLHIDWYIAKVSDNINDKFYTLCTTHSYIQLKRFFFITSLTDAN